jgi:hypothetical protein
VKAPIFTPGARGDMQPFVAPGVGLRRDPATQAYAARRTAEGKTPKEIRRCLAQHLARQLFRRLEHTPEQVDTR